MFPENDSIWLLKSPVLPFLRREHRQGDLLHSTTGTFVQPNVISPTKEDRAEVERVKFQKGPSCQQHTHLTSVDPCRFSRVTATGSLPAPLIHQLRKLLPPTHQPEGVLTQNKAEARLLQSRTTNANHICKSERSMCSGKCCFSTHEKVDEANLSYRQCNYSSPSTKPPVQILACTKYLELCHVILNSATFYSNRINVQISIQRTPKSKFHMSLRFEEDPL